MGLQKIQNFSLCTFLNNNYRIFSHEYRFETEDYTFELASLYIYIYIYTIMSYIIVSRENKIIKGGFI